MRARGVDETGIKQSVLVFIFYKNLKITINTINTINKVSRYKALRCEWSC